MDWREKPRIGVMGSSVCDDEIYRLAREVGRRIAEQGSVLVCGGGRGVMEAAARGAKEAGGLTLGILPGERDSEANPYIDIPVVTGLGNARNVVNVLTSQAVIAIHGGAGTLSEIALASKVGTPVVLLRSWRIAPPGERSPAGWYEASSAEEAVASALRLAQRRSG